MTASLTGSYQVVKCGDTLVQATNQGNTVLIVCDNPEALLDPYGPDQDNNVAFYPAVLSEYSGTASPSFQTLRLLFTIGIIEVLVAFISAVTLSKQGEPISKSQGSKDFR